jgi:hypothetical protein
MIRNNGRPAGNRAAKKSISEGFSSTSSLPVATNNASRATRGWKWKHFDVDELPDHPALAKPTTYKGYMQRLCLKFIHDLHEATGDLPTNNRFIFYEIEQAGLVHKPASNGDRYGDQMAGPSYQNVINAVMQLRELEVIPWRYIVDETRTLYNWQHAPSVAVYVKEAVNRARINPWPGEPPLLLVESRSLAGVLRKVAADYLAPLAATNGQVGGFLHTDIVPILRRNDRPVLYMGDSDIAGHLIEANTKSVLERKAMRPIDWTRIAITQDQIEERGLEPIVKVDQRYGNKQPHEAFETEALGQGTIEQIVRRTLDQLLPEPLERVLEKEDEQREQVAEVLDELTEDEW